MTALDRAFAELDRLGAAKKAIIFTESKRTQEYLLNLLADTPYGDGIVLFNGTNSDQRAQAIYKDWLKRHEGTDRITGSKTADTRAALVEHFKERGTVMIATEAGAEGINLQFCSLVINYDLPWKERPLDGARLVFDYDAYGSQVSTLKAYRGKTGWLALKLVSVEALGNQEQHLVVAASTADGIALAEDDPEKLLRMPATAQSAGLFNAGDARRTSRARLAQRRDGDRPDCRSVFPQRISRLSRWRNGC